MTVTVQGAAVTTGGVAAVTPGSGRSPRSRADMGLRVTWQRLLGLYSPVFKGYSMGFSMVFFRVLLRLGDFS